jgi:putative membrane protein
VFPELHRTTVVAPARSCVGQPIKELSRQVALQVPNINERCSSFPGCVPASGASTGIALSGSCDSEDCLIVKCGDLTGFITILGPVSVYLPAIRVEREGWTVFAVMAVILGLANAIIRPILKFLSCPLILLTLGLFVLVINGITLWLASAIAVRWFHVGFYVDGFWAAFLGVLIVSLVSLILSMLVREQIQS